jgi:hypothetical protein
MFTLKTVLTESAADLLQLLNEKTDVSWGFAAPVVDFLTQRDSRRLLEALQALPRETNLRPELAALLLKLQKRFGQC